VSLRQCRLEAIGCLNHLLSLPSLDVRPPHNLAAHIFWLGWTRKCHFYKCKPQQGT
jgi:hypothetical protein